MSEKVRACGALWLKESAKGKYFSGEVEFDGVKRQIVVFRNTFKEPGSKQPDYKILPATPREDRMNPDDRRVADEDSTPF